MERIDRWHRYIMDYRSPWNLFLDLLIVWLVVAGHIASVSCGSTGFTSQPDPIALFYVLWSIP
ncbi:hypothetical protein HQO42_01045 [Rhodococcus fascians]|nr:hypothetical protein [Rhodococcus fascians]MBY4266874.1 hypothetical protein [Rhodococcus fascians]